MEKDGNDERIMKKAPDAVEITAQELDFRVDIPGNFASTAELPEKEDLVGQNRAVSALQLVIGIAGSTHHLFVSGLTGSEKLNYLKEWISHRCEKEKSPGDILYVHNFKNPDEPRSLYLPAGGGKKLKTLLRDLVRTLRDELPKAFRQEAFDREKSNLKEKYNNRSNELNSSFEKIARERGFVVNAGQNGNFLFIPIINGKPLENQEEFQKLSEEEKERISHNQNDLSEDLEKLARDQQDLIRELEEEIRQIERRFCGNILKPLMERIEAQVADPKTSVYLKEMNDHIIDNLNDFKSRPVQQFGFAQGPPEPDEHLEYDVNVVVDNSNQAGAPVVIEDSPIYINLFGSIERVVDRYGRLVTNFTRIKSGSLLKANGGYLIFNLEDAITEPAVWKTLKRILRSGSIKMETYEPFAIFSTSGLRPEPVNVQVKIIAVGSPYLYQLLYQHDDDFPEIFQLHADFRQSVELNEENIDAFAHMTAAFCRRENLPHLDRSGLGTLLQLAARWAQDREKMVISRTQTEDTLREAAYLARSADSQFITGVHIDESYRMKVFRSGRLEEELREMIVRGVILIDIDGKKKGQVNGLSVIDMGGYMFGRPSRVTASTAIGQGGIVNIERESNLGGNIHNKGVLIIAGYLRNTFGQERPLTLSASLCFEQSYSGVEGDSASSAELYTLLSRLADIPLRQDLAVTGSVNQWGQIQAIGGVNEKIEGFYDVCRVKGLTGSQGVVIPASNIRHIIMRKDIIEEVREGKFHIYPVKTVEQGMEILTGIQWGSADEEGTICGDVNSLFDKYYTAMKNQPPGEEKK